MTPDAFLGMPWTALDNLEKMTYVFAADEQSKYWLLANGSPSSLTFERCCQHILQVRSKSMCLHMLARVSMLSLQS